MLPGSNMVRLAGAISLLVSTSYQLWVPPTADNAISLSGRDDPGSGSPSIESRQFDGRKPIWMIAHKCLDTKAIDDAIGHGANAFEMDLTAYSEGWWAQHPGEKYWDSISKLFDHIIDKQGQGANIQWVWLDIKTPDAYPSGVGSIQGLQKLVRDKLTFNGIAALYGFAGTGKAFDYIKTNLQPLEAINYDGSTDDKNTNMTPRDTINYLGDVGVGHRVASYGWTDLSHSFGDSCYEDSYFTCTELRIAHESKKWGKVFGWTAADQQTTLINKLFDLAHVDGLIYGFMETKYYKHPESDAAAADVKAWINSHSDTVKLADDNDAAPWAGTV